MTDAKLETTPQKRSLTSILVWCGGILGALAVIVTKATTIATTIETLYRAEFPLDPYAVEVSKPEIVPSYLHYFYGAEGLGARESLYWFHERVQNKTRGPLNLQIVFTLEPSDCNYVVLEGGGPIEDTLRAREQKEVKVSPRLVFNIDKFEADCFLKVQWTIQDPQKDKTYLKAGNVEIRLLPPNVVKWDLLNADNKPVSREFLVASLTSWSLSREGAVLNRAAQLRKRANVSSPEQWVRSCYEDLFEGRSALAIDSSRRTYPFPLAGQTIISSPGQVLLEGRAEPLEASFAMAALIHTAPLTERARLTLFIVPRLEDPRNPSMFLAWLLPDHRTWEAVDLREARKLRYDVNVNQSQPQIKLLLEEHPEILRSLKAKGVFTQPEPNAVTALSFDHAVTYFGIRALD